MPDDSTMPSPSRDGADDPQLDPVELELIAYLDGELDPAAARKVEARMAADPKLRARAESLRRSYALLDFLPKSEPSATFTSRTLDKLPAVKSSPTGSPVSVPPPTRPSSSIPVVLATGTGSLSFSGLAPAPPRSGPGVLWAAGLILVVGAALGGGYLLTAAIRGHPSAPAIDLKEPTAADLRAPKNLPLYAAVDDFEMLSRSLASPEFFGEDPAVVSDGPTAIRPVETEPTTEANLADLTRTFRSFPPERQEKIRQLEHSLDDLDSARRDRLFRVLESYSAWLYRLPDADRKTILSAPTAEKRLEAILEVRRAQWVAHLPTAQRKQLQNLPGAERAALINQWKTEEIQRRESWRLPRAVTEAHRTGHPPWPFNDTKLRLEVIDFARTAYQPDDPTRSRLSSTDLARLQISLKLAQTEDGPEAAWLGLLLYEFNRPEGTKHLPRYELLPEPGTGKPVTEISDLWPAAIKHYDNNSRPGLHRKVIAHAGKWPDFAREVWDDLASAKKKLDIPSNFHFGPAKPDEFKPELKRFVQDVLIKKLTPAQAASLKSSEGKWPEYPRELIRLARIHQLSVPGVMLPGSPEHWKRAYDITRQESTRAGG
jgi:hypothetical protein